MKTVALFGASGGLGSQLLPLLETKYIVLGISSSDIDVTDFKQVNEFFSINNILFFQSIMANISNINIIIIIW